MNTNTITPEVETLTPEEFITRVHTMCGSVEDTLADYFVRNLDTGKLELHIDKPTYDTFSTEDKQSLWDSFRWSRKVGCWISRGLPYEDLDHLATVAGLFGLADGGYFVTLRLDDAGKAEVTPAPAPAKPEPVAAPVAAPAAPKAKRPETIFPNRKIFTGTIGVDEIEHALQHGSGFAEGKVRIAAFFASDHTPDECKKFLKEEYGIGGNSHNFLNGASGMVDHDGSGLTIRSGFHGEGAELKLSWVSVASYLRTMVREGRFLTGKDAERYAAVAKHFNGKIPSPTPRYGWAALKDA